MAYYFAVETEKNNYVAINIKRCRHYFNTNYKYEEPFACTLKEINNITTKFQNEEQLKASLVSVYGLTNENRDKPLAILYSDGIERRLVDGKVLYEESRNLIEEPLEVITYIDAKARENDYTFFRQLAETLSDDSISKSLVSKIASLIEKSISSGIRDMELSKTNVLGNNIVTATAKLLIYTNRINDSGEISHTNKINYENLHNLVSFITDYEKSLNKDKKTQHKKVLTQENASN